MEPTEKRTAAMFKALGEENRIRILKLLQTGENAPASCWTTCASPSPPCPTICVSSATPASLRDAYYSISARGAEEAAKALRELTAACGGACRRK